MNREVPPRPGAHTASSGSRSTDPAPVLRSEDLFRGGPEVRVVHAGHEYRLRITRQGKLILTK